MQFAKPELVTPKQSEAGGLSLKWQFFLFILAVIAIISRRPDAIFNPQFYGEDGTIWYSEAYNFGWFHSLLHAQNGYFQTLPRLAAALALLVPLHLAPLVTNSIGIVLQALPAWLLLSSRCAAWAPLNIRGWFAIAYIGLPNTMELDATITEGQWHLALLACILILAAPPKTLAWRIFDCLVFLLDCLTGPFCLLLLPIAILMWFFRRNLWRLFIAFFLAAGACLELSSLYVSAASSRSQAPLGASISLFLRLLGGQVYLAALTGMNSVAHSSTAWGLIVLAIAATALVVYCAINAPLELRLFILFSALIFAASLRTPMADAVHPQWPVLAIAQGIRYWFFPMLAFVWSLIRCITSTEFKPLQVLSSAGILVFLFGVVRDWRYPAYTDQHFRSRAKQWEASPAGTLATIPIYPDGWSFQLTKRGYACGSLPIGVVDLPANNAVVSGDVSAVGWVSATRRIRSVSVYLDGRWLQKIRPGIPRPDVDQSYPDAAKQNKGWQTSIESFQLNPGQHELEVWAREEGGCNAEIATRTFEYSR